MFQLSPRTSGGVVQKFHFVNLLTYPVYGRDKTFDMDKHEGILISEGVPVFQGQLCATRNVWTCAFLAQDGVRIVYIRGFVYHFMSCDPALTVYVSLNGDTGDVYSAQCNCVACLGEACKHVAALLFCVENAAKKKLKKLPSELSKTSMPMRWNQPPKKHDPSRLKDFIFEV